MNRSAWVVGLLAALGVGAITAVQMLINGELGVRVGDPLLGAAWSFVTAGIIVTLIVLLRSSSRRAFGLFLHRVQTGELPWWLLIASLFGACFVSIGAWTVPIIGVAVFSVAMVAGQNIGALAIDRFGLTGIGPQPLNAGRLVAAFVGLGAAAVAAAPALGAATASVVLVAAVIIGGACASTQFAISGRMSLASGDTWIGAWGGFGLASLLFLIVVIVRSLFGGTSAAAVFPVFMDSPLLAIGGALGSLLMFLAAISVVRIGVLIFGLTAVVGQFTFAVIIDALTGRSTAFAYILIAIVLTAVSVGLATIATRSSSLTSASS